MQMRTGATGAKSGNVVATDFRGVKASLPFIRHPIRCQRVPNDQGAFTIATASLQLSTIFHVDDIGRS